MANGDAPDPQDQYLPPAQPPLGPAPPQVAIGPGAGMALANPPAASPAAPPAPDPADAARTAAWNAAAARMQALTEREEKLSKQKQKALAPMYDEARAASRGLARTSEQATQQFLASQQEIPPYHAPDFRQNMGSWMMMAAAFGAIGNAFARSSSANAFTAFAGMLNGANKGEVEVFDQQYQAWQANAKAAEAYNRQALTRYKAVMDNAQLNWDQKAAQIKMTADQYQDAIMSSAAEQKNITAMMEIYDKQDRFAQGMQVRRESLEMRKKWQDNWVERQKISKEMTAESAALRADEVADAALSRFEPVAAYQGKVLRDLIAKVNPSDYTSYNEFQQALRRAGGDADVNQFIASLESYRTELGKILGSNLQGAGSLTNQQKGEANNILQQGASPVVINRVTKFFESEFKYKRELVAADAKYRQGKLKALGTAAEPTPYEAPQMPPTIPPGTEGTETPVEDYRFD
jgi:hypothetical protein